MKEAMKSDFDNKDAQKNGRTSDKRKWKAPFFGSSGIAYLGPAEDNKGLRRCPFRQNLCFPTEMELSERSFESSPKYLIYILRRREISRDGMVTTERSRILVKQFANT
jgi:hypothetical protein